MRSRTLHARSVALGRAAAAVALREAIATFEAWHDERQMRECFVCLGAFVRPRGQRQGARIYCSDGCRQAAYRLRHPGGRRPAPVRAPGLPFPDTAADLVATS